MQAHPGDQVVVEGHPVGHPRRVGTVLEVHGEGGRPPYLVRWAGETGSALIYPGPDAHIEPGEQGAVLG